MKYAETLGYRLGRLVLPLKFWNRQFAVKIKAKGWPHWISKLPLLLFLTVVSGLLIASFFILVTIIIFGIFVVLMMLALSSSFKDGTLLDDKRLYMNGYMDGPEGTGEYSSGQRIDND